MKRLEHEHGEPVDGMQYQPAWDEIHHPNRRKLTRNEVHGALWMIEQRGGGRVGLEMLAQELGTKPEHLHRILSGKAPMEWEALKKFWEIRSTVVRGRATGRNGQGGSVLLAGRDRAEQA